MRKQSIEKWRAVRFESSTGRTPEFAAFARAYRSAIRKQLAAQGLRLVKFSTGHFYCSWFAYNPEREQYCYGSCPDVRYWPDDWFASILVRHAKHDKDYTGGANHYATLGTIGVMASDITKRGY